MRIRAVSVCMAAVEQKWLLGVCIRQLIIYLVEAEPFGGGGVVIVKVVLEERIDNVVHREFMELSRNLYFSRGRCVQVV